MKTKTANALPSQVTNSSIILTSIFTTTNYSMFGFIGGNRNVNQTNLKKITESISKKHIKTNAVICILDESDTDQPLKIVDGQHRFEACEKLQIPVSYVIDDSLNLDSILNDITLMNTASKEWDVSDFMNSEAQKGNQNYILYRDIYTKYSENFDHEALFFILNNDSGREYPNVGYPMFKQGKLQFEKSDSTYLSNRLTEISKFNVFSEIGGKRYYQKALNLLFNCRGFDSDHMMNKLQHRVSTIQKCSTIEGALDQLSDIYNHKQQTGRVAITRVGSKIVKIEII